MSDSSTGEPQVSNMAALTSVVVFFGAVFLVLFMIFLFIRNRFQSLYNPRRTEPEVQCELAQQDFKGFQWITGVFKATDEELAEQCGLDQVAFIRTLRMGAKLSAMGCFIAIWLIPTYRSSPREMELPDGTKTPRSNYDVTDDLDLLSMGHTHQGDPRMIGALFASYLMCGFAMALLYQEVTWYVSERQKFLARQTAQNHTVYVSGIPAELQSRQALQRYFNTHFRDEVSDVQVVRHVEALQKLCAKRDALAPKLAHSKAILQVKGLRPRHKVSSSMCGSKTEVDSIEHQQAEMDELSSQIASAIAEIEAECAEHEQKVADGDTHALSHPPPAILDAAFVSFSSLRSSNAARAEILHHKPFGLLCQAAPAAQDVYWSNVGMGHWVLQGRTILAGFLTGVTCLLWTIPVAAVATLSKVEELKKLGPSGCEAAGDCPLMVAGENFSLLDELLAVLSPVGLIVLNALLPIILGAYSALEGHVGTDALQGALFGKLALFMIVQTFFVSALGGAIFARLADVADDPAGEVQDILASSLPQQSVTFMSLLFVKVTVGLALELLRPAPAIIAWIRARIGPNLTTEESRQPFLGLNPLNIPGFVKYTVLYSDSVLMYTVLFVYSVLSPITSVLLLPAFLLLEAVYRHQMIFVYDPRNDTQGRIWPKWSGFVVASMLIAQVTVMAVLAVNEYGGAPFMLPLIVVTVLFWRYLQQQHWRVANGVPVHASLASEQAHPVDCAQWVGEYKQQALVAVASELKPGAGFAGVKAAPDLEAQPPPPPQLASQSDVADRRGLLGFPTGTAVDGPGSGMGEAAGGQGASAV